MRFQLTVDKNGEAGDVGKLVPEAGPESISLPPQSYPNHMFAIWREERVTSEVSPLTGNDFSIQTKALWFRAISAEPALVIRPFRCWRDKAHVFHPG